jgi:hypothetical protein
MTILLVPPLYEIDLFDSADALRNACVDFAKSDGYVVNQRDIDKNRSRLRLKCAHKTTTKQGGGASKYNKSHRLPIPNNCIEE